MSIPTLKSHNIFQGPVRELGDFCVMTEPRKVRDSVLNAELKLSFIKKHEGTTSPHYKAALQNFANSWVALRDSRDPQEFLWGAV